VPLVLLHGFPLDHRMWAACAGYLPPGIRAIGVDLPGAGHSDLDGYPPSIEHMADAVYRTMIAAGEGNAIVVGHSMGGYVALALAERHPGFVAGLGLVNTKSTADTEEVRAKRLRIAAAADASQTVDAVLGMPANLVGATSTERRRHLFPVLDSWIRAQSPAGVAWAQRAMAARPDRTAASTRRSPSWWARRTPSLHWPRPSTWSGQQGHPRGSPWATPRSRWCPAPGT